MHFFIIICSELQAAVCAGCDGLEEWGAVLTAIFSSFAFTGGRHLLEKWESILHQLLSIQTDAYIFYFY